jgi:ubiquinone biosynthesis protein
VLGDALVRFFRGSGPFLTKLGQLLATRTDLLPPTVCSRLEALYTEQPPMSRSQLKGVLNSCYPKKSPFREFETRPIAVGSIGQVHRARLRNGKRVVVKVLRPGVEKSIRRDVNAAKAFVEIFFRSLARGSKLTQLLIRKALEDLGRAFESEANREHEADALEEFRERFRRNPRICVPVCYRRWSSKEILVLEELSGEALSAIRKRAQSDPEAARKVADLALREILTQVFREGRFHADPHGGNLLVLHDGRLGLIDLGLTGELRDVDRRNITRAVRAFMARDADASIRALLEFGVPPPDFDLETFKRDVHRVLDQTGRKMIAQVTGQEQTSEQSSNRLEQLVNELLAVGHRHHIYFPPSTTLLIKTLVTIEGVTRSLDPEINVARIALPIILRSLAPGWLRWRHWRGARPTSSPGDSSG